MFREIEFPSAKQLNFVLKYLGQNAKLEFYGVQQSCAWYTLEYLKQTYTEVKRWWNVGVLKNPSVIMRTDYKESTNVKKQVKRKKQNCNSSI